MSGEATSRSNIDLPGDQQQLIDRIKATGKPFVVVLFNGRPLTLQNVAASSPAILEAWFPGVQAGNAVADVLFGKVNPGGKLPVSFPVNVGQVPIYYNHEPTGRPCDATSKYNSRYRDLNTCDPLYSFGYGLSYTTFSISNLELSSTTMPSSGCSRRQWTSRIPVVAPATRWCSSTSTTQWQASRSRSAGCALLNASLWHPARPRPSRSRSTATTSASTTTWDGSSVEPGQIDVYVGDSSKATLTKSFTVTR